MSGSGNVSFDEGFGSSCADENAEHQQLSHSDPSKENEHTPHSFSSNPATLRSDGYKDRAVTQSTPILNTIAGHSPKDVESEDNSDSLSTARKANAPGRRKWKSETNLPGICHGV